MTYVLPCCTLSLFWFFSGAPPQFSGRRIFELVGRTCLYSESRLDPSLFANKMHSHIGLKIRDSALGVLEHRQRQACTAG